MTLGTRLKQLFQFGPRFYWCFYYAAILCSFILIASEERHEALTCLICKTKCCTSDKKQAIMVLWRLKHSGQVTISCSVPRFIGPCSGKSTHHNGLHYTKQHALNRSHNSCLSRRARATSGASSSQGISASQRFEHFGEMYQLL